MANKTIGIQLSAYSGVTGLTIRVKQAGSILNDPLDTLTETDSTGYFTATLTEATSAGWYSVDVLSGASVLQSGGDLYLPGDVEGTYLVDDPSVSKNANLTNIASFPVAVDTGTEGVVSFVSNAFVATQGGTVNANVVEIDGEEVKSDGNGRLEVDLQSIAGVEDFVGGLNTGLEEGILGLNATSVRNTVLGANAPVDWFNAASIADGAIHQNAISENGLESISIGVAEGIIDGLDEWVAAIPILNEAVLEAIDGIETGGGTNGVGERKITVTVQRSTDSVKMNNVRVSVVGTTTFDHTNTLGVAELNVGPNATYTLRITPPSGYEAFSDVTQAVVTSDVTRTVNLVPTTIEISSPPLCNVSLPTTSQYGRAFSGVSVSIKFVEFNDSADPSTAIVNAESPIKSNENGVVVTPLLRNAKYVATYRIGKETPKKIEFEVPDAGSYVVVES